MEAAAKRTQLLKILTSLGVELAPQNKLPDDALEKRLRRAIDEVQHLSTLIPSRPLLPRSLEEWKGTEGSLIKAMTRVNLEEVVLNTAARKQYGMTNANDTFADPLSDLGQTVIAMAELWTRGHRSCIIKDVNDVDSGHGIYVRVSMLLMFTVHTNLE